MKIPIVDKITCVDCDICVDLCPAVFKRIGDGSIAVIALPAYPEQEVNAVIQDCLGNCISWEEV